MKTEKLIKKFEENIYRYCDDNVKEKILFTGFTWMFPEYEKIAPAELANITSIFVYDLVKKKILKNITKNFESLYGLYEILPHERLVKNIEKKLR